MRINKKIGIGGRAQRRAVGLRLLVHNIAANANVHGGRHMQLIACRQHTVPGIGEVVLYNPLAQRLACAQAQLGALVQGADVLGVLLPKAKLALADILCHAFRGGANHGKLKIVDGGGAVESKMGDIALFSQANEAGPAAIDQLQVVGGQAGAPVFTLPGAKPPEIARKALAHARDYGNDIVILDTAGRLQIDEVLMQELVQIKEAVPVDETLLVVDAMAGQDAVNVAKTFNEMVGIDGIILTKTDGDTRGGAALSVLSVTGKPIKFQGTGEKLDDLEVFHPSRMASRILGMGDVLSLIEKAQDAADEKAAEETARRMMENKFDMNDMLAQFAQIRKMGGAGAMLSMMPGMSGIDASQIDEKAFDRIEAMIYSMTKEEREKPSIINPKRKRRIAAGSGTRVEDVNKLLKQFEMMQKMMKQFKKSPKGFARRLGGMMGNPNAFRGFK